MIALGEMILTQRESSDSELSLRSYEFLNVMSGFTAYASRSAWVK